MTGERSTRDRIIDSALALFNEHGTRAVSTNRIATSVGISPGNLYYHFSDKEEIIRAIYERAIADGDTMLAAAATVPPDPAGAMRIFHAIFEHQLVYRFLQREFPALVRTDDRLRTRYREMQARRIAFHYSLARYWMATGTLKPMTDEELSDLVMAIWLIGDSWLSYLEATSDGGDETEQHRGERLIYNLLRPHLAAQADEAGPSESTPAAR